MKNILNLKEREKELVVVISSLLFNFALLVLLSSTNVVSYNYDHVNVTTRVNITNAFPEILNVTAEGYDLNVTLSAGATRSIECNATIRDYNGGDDLDVVAGYLYYYLNSSEHSDDDNEHYTNSSCIATDNDGQYLVNYTCTFQVQYFANNGTWNCNISVNDSINNQDSEEANTTIDPLYALNVTDTIDYGNLSVTETSENITATVTNFGNMDINVSVLGYGETEGDGIGLVCSVGSNISVENQRFSSTQVEWGSKSPLSISNQDVGATVSKQTDDTTPVTQSTYWQLYVPPNPFGLCTGTVRFTATTP